jgi:hypothetical protein
MVPSSDTAVAAKWADVCPEGEIEEPGRFYGFDTPG